LREQGSGKSTFLTTEDTEEHRGLVFFCVPLCSLW
jgi:hypothetical protein